MSGDSLALSDPGETLDEWMTRSRCVSFDAQAPESAGSLSLEHCYRVRLMRFDRPEAQILSIRC
jgi:hypothetical protein